MRLGLIGLGKWALKIQSALPLGVHFAAVATQRRDARSVLAPHTAIYSDLNDFLDTSLDGVIVANEASRHLATLRAIWKRSPGLPVFVEKPLGLDIQEALDLERFHRQQGGGIFLVDHVLLFNTNFLDLSQRLASPPVGILGWDANQGPFRSDCHPLWDYGPHALSIVMYLYSLFTATDPLHADRIEVLSAVIEPSNSGSMLSFEIELGSRCRACLFVGNGSEHKKRHYTITTKEGEVWRFNGLEPCTPMPLNAVLAAFCQAIEHGYMPEEDRRWGWTLPLQVGRVLAEVGRRLGVPAKPSVN